MCSFTSLTRPLLRSAGGMLILALAWKPAHAQQREPEGVADSASWSVVDDAVDRKGTSQAGGVRRYSFPRSDLAVSVGEVRVKPALALGSWLAMKRQGRGVLAMGDLVLTEEELAPVMSKLQSVGIHQTALHHHVLHEQPRVLYMHVHATGDPVNIGRSVRAALALTKSPAGAAPAGPQREMIDLDTARLAQILGHGGKVSGGVFQVSVARTETIRDGGMEVPASMGLTTAINFQPIGAGRAAITGDFVMTAGEVNLVIQALRAGGIEVTSLHNHLLTEEPRLFFMHFWAVDDAVKLAQTLRQALERTHSKRSS
jgi:hypothetical protein